MKKEHYIRSEFIRNILTLMTGTAFSQMIPILMMPVITRIYSPKSFGVLALILSIIQILSIVSAGRYEIAIMLPKKDDDAIGLMIISISIAVIVSGLIFIGIIIFHEQIVEYIGSYSIYRWIYFIPFSVLFTSMNQIFNYWSSRGKKYKILALSKISQSSTKMGIQIIFGYAGVGVGGLILGDFFGRLIGSIFLFKMIMFDYLEKFKEQTKDKLIILLKRFRKFPMYSTWGALLDVFSVQLPLIALAHSYDNSVVGYFSLSLRVLNMPLSLISRSLSQVLFQKISKINNTDMSLVILKLFFALCFIVFPVVLVVAFWGEEIFIVFFGAKWSIAGEYSQILIFAIAIRFIVSPLSVVMSLDHNIKQGVLWQVLYFTTLGLVFLFGSKLTIKNLLYLFVAAEIILYTLYFFFILRTSRKGIKCVEYPE